MVVTRAVMWEAVPFTVMVAMEACTIGLTILAKTAITNGMSPFVFVVYTNAIATILLLPYSFMFHCSDRTTILDWRTSSLQAKVIGTLISIMGATMVELYRGPVILPSSVSSYFLQLKQQSFIFSSTTEHWILGGILLAVSSLSVSVWNIIQLGTVTQYPELQVMKAVSFCSFLGTVQCALVSSVLERDLSAWKLKLNMELLLIVSTGVFGGLIRASVHLWCTQSKGPFYVPMFKPFGILFATIFGLSFFTNSLHYGSVIGAIIVGIGYYAVMWAQVREDEAHEDHSAEIVDSLEKRVPLLQEEMQV
ncbi:hypothetical protein CJ030_MR0G007659 [Morella rubra]|uniref:WAT1-related protein n=1 Tax=Morella rubra TaxID=262757 RepID=A0A6A1UJ79_9ROSI|nr:hypothetical protein CJ030_MR0G007659 [Morella rubra]